MPNRSNCERYVGPALRGEEIWCQLFSEPAGGSDVAALRTRAERDGDDWIINGQKIWTSGAHYSDFGMLLVTAPIPTVPKHAGLTLFFLDMKRPGIEVRPIHQMSGASQFQRGVLHRCAQSRTASASARSAQGWKVALTTLMNERLAVGDIAAARTSTTAGTGRARWRWTAQPAIAQRRGARAHRRLVHAAAGPEVHHASAP